MEEGQHENINLQRSLSKESTTSALSDDSCEYYQTDIYEQLPSSLPRRRWQNRAQKAEAEIDDLSPAYKDWDINQPLKMLPLCIQEKRNLRDQRQLQRLSISYWMSWRRSQQIAWRRLKEQMSGFFSGLRLWKHTLHRIECRFGVGVKAYFVFLRYLLCLNLLNCTIIAGSVIIPSLYGGKMNDYKRWIPEFTGNDSVLDIFLGSGFLERSPVFYGFYTFASLYSDCWNTSFLFFFGMVTILFLSLVMIVRRTIVSYKHMWLTGSRSNLNCSYKVFCGWDFCIQDPQAAFLKHSFIRNELKMDLEEQKFREKVSQRSLKRRIFLYFLRVLLNFTVLVLLAGSFFLIYYATTTSQKTMVNLHWTLQLFMEYLPPITITTINILLPHLFCTIAVFEDYFLTTQLNLTLVRSIFLKLASLGMYLFFLTNNENKTTCMETEFGKEMYKLTIFQLLACFCNAYLVAYPRTLIVEKCSSCSLVRIAGKEEFVIPLNVLDLVYSQTVTWVGVFYCPLLPAISILKLLAIFYMKKFIVFRCCAPAQRMFRTSSSKVLFNFMLLLGLIMSSVTLGVNINNFSSNCGPFKENRTVFNVTSECVNTLPGPAQLTLRYITSEAFAFIVILAELIILTSFVSQSRSNRRAIDRLRDMLVMCSSDKRFLVKQHSTWLRQQTRNQTSKASTEK